VGHEFWSAAAEIGVDGYIYAQRLEFGSRFVRGHLENTCSSAKENSAALAEQCLAALPHNRKLYSNPRLRIQAAEVQRR
jgi:hypothetical protein